MKMNKLLLLFIGPVASQSGYGHHAADVCRSIIKSDKYDVKVLVTNWGMTPNNALNEKNPDDKMLIDRFVLQQLSRQPDVLIQLALPTEFNPMGKYNIGITAGVEANVCSPQFIEGMNKMNMVIVPSTFTRDVFMASTFDKVNNINKQVEGVLKCEVPIEVIFEGADINIYKKTSEIHKSIIDKLEQISETFVFLFVGHWLPGDIGHDRKDLGMLIKTFFQTFRNNPNQPALLLKTSRGTFSTLDREEVVNRIQSIRNLFNKKDILPNVYLLHGDLTDEEMNSLYNHPKVKAHISFTHGEGFGRPILEASLSGKPLLVSSWSGHMDFVKREFSTLIPGKLIDVHPSAIWEPVIIKGSKWFQVDYNYTSQVMRDIKRNYKNYAERALKQKNYSKENFNIEKMKEKIVEVLDKYVPNMPTQMDVVMPNIDLESVELPKLSEGK